MSGTPRGHGWGLALAMALLAGCASKPAPQPAADAENVILACGEAALAAVCLRLVDMPAAQQARVATAARQAIAILHDPAYVQDLATFQCRHAAQLAGYPAWQGLDAAGIVGRVRHAIEGASVTTHGGLRGAWLWHNPLIRNRAFEGRRLADGSRAPLSLNAAALRSARPAEIVNSLVHELAHGAGFQHPSYADQAYVGLCEPPYVLGSLAERRAGGRLRGDHAHCGALLAEPND